MARAVVGAFVQVQKSVKLETCEAVKCGRFSPFFYLCVLRDHKRSPTLFTARFFYPRKFGPKQVLYFVFCVSINTGLRIVQINLRRSLLGQEKRLLGVN